MGSCISPIIANLYMEHIEHTAITTFHTPPSLWYVDDTFYILDKKHIFGFHSHLNSICSHIQFTMENEHDFSLPFLDVLVSRNVCKENNTTNTSLTTAIYKKTPTRTDTSTTLHIILNTKLTVTKTLLNRVETHISHTDKNQKSGELRNICFTQETELNLIYNTSNISVCESSKYLGVTIDHRLSFKLHILSLETRVSRSVGILSKLRSTFPSPTLLLLYHALVQPHLVYVLPLWGSTFKTYLSKLQILQNKALRIITKSDWRTPITSKFRNLKILKIADLYTFELAKLIINTTV